MKNYKHIIITRFNLDFSKMPSYDPSYAGYQRTAVWDKNREDHRLRLLEDIPGQCILSQSNKNFEWVLACNPHTSSELKHRLDLLSKKIGFIPCYAEDGIKHVAGMGKNHKFLITTRLDADDGISTDFVDLVQQEFSEQEFQFINFNIGFQKKLGDKKSFLAHYDYNPFQSLVEISTNPKTIFCVQHHLSYTVGKVRAIQNTHPVWLQVIHEDNIANPLMDYEQHKEYGDLKKWFCLGEGS